MGKAYGSTFRDPDAAICRANALGRKFGGEVLDNGNRLRYCLDYYLTCQMGVHVGSAAVLPIRRFPALKSIQTPSRQDSLTTLTERAYQLIRHQILHGELESDTILSERMLTERLQLGKAPVRAAVQRLASEGLMTIEPRRGMVVASQSVQDVLDLYEVRVVLEQLVARGVAGRVNAEQADRLYANIDEHRAVVEKLDPAATLAVDFSFHRMLCELHGNAHLGTMLNRLLDWLYPELHLAHKRSRDRAREAIDEHQAIAEAVIRGDGAEAERLMAAHLGSCRAFVMSRGAHDNGTAAMGRHSASSDKKAKGGRPLISNPGPSELNPEMS